MELALLAFACALVAYGLYQFIFADSKIEDGGDSHSHSDHGHH